MQDNDTSAVSTNLLGRHVTWYGDDGHDGGSVIAVTFWQGAFVLLIATYQGLRQKTATSVKLDG